MSHAKHKAVFLDRDNTLVEDPGYISHPSQVKLLGGTAASLVQLRKMDFMTVVVSNQSGVARGIVTEEVLAQIHHQLEKLLADEGAYLDAIYYCPFHPDGVISKYRMESEMRKPAPGMLLKAAEDHNIDLSRSWMIGDSYRDVEAGKRAGCKTILINNPVKPVVKNPSEPAADRQAVNIREAVNIIRMHELRQSMETTLEHKEHEPAQTPPPQTPPPAVKESSPSAVLSAPETSKLPDIQKPDPTVNEDLKDKMKPSEPVKAEQVTPVATSHIPADPPARNLNDSVEQKMVPEPVKTQAAPSTGTQEPHLSSKTELLLQELLGHLKSAHRVGQFEDFTLSKVASGATQFMAIVCLVVSLLPLIDSTHGENWTFMMLGYATVLQLMAIAFYMMRER
jgi:D-glycero-D-manno-heptose 1,7-bisphosphate phosphatase